MELRDIDVNEAAEPVEPSATEPETQIEESDESQIENHEPAREPAQEPVEDPTNGQKENQEQPQEPEKPKHSRAEERIRDVVQENKILKQKLEQFSQQTAPELQKEEIDFNDLNKVINERALQAAELMIASQNVGVQVKNQAEKWANDFESVKKTNPQLDPESPEYDRDLDTTLARLLDDGTGVPRTDILVSDIIGTFKKRETATQAKAIEEGKSQATIKLAQQIAEGALTPGAKQPSKPDGELSDEESESLRNSNPKEWLKRL